MLGAREKEECWCFWPITMVVRTPTNSISKEANRKFHTTHSISKGRVGRCKTANTGKIPTWLLYLEPRFMREYFYKRDPDKFLPILASWTGQAEWAARA